MFSFTKKLQIPGKEECLPGRTDKIKVSALHHVLNTKLDDEFIGYEFAMFGMGCFWGAERKFWQADGVHSTQVGYSAGHTPNPTYQEVCSGMTGHNEVVRVIFDPKKISYLGLLKIFWENHDPTQGMRQGNDVGTQYRSGIYYYNDQQDIEAKKSKDEFEKALVSSGHGEITSEIVEATHFYFAEDYHQQYLSKNPGGYCGLGGTGVSCPIGLKTSN